MRVRDLVVIGAGYWGIAIAYEARKLGWDVVVLDDGDPLSGSRAASGIVDPAVYRSDSFRKYWPADWDVSELDYSLNWLMENAGAYRVREGFLNHFSGTPPRPGAEAIYLPDFSILIRLGDPVTRGEVAARLVDKSDIDLATYGLVSPGGPRTEYPMSWSIRSRRLVVACGYRTDEVLARIGLPSVGVSRLYGRGIVAAGIPAVGVPVSVMLRPYLKHTVREWRPSPVTGMTRYKVGDTAEVKGPPAAGQPDKAMEALRQVGRLVLGGYREVGVTSGYRPVASRFLVEKLDPFTVVATGGHRVGLGLSGLVAKKVLEAFR